MKTQTSTTTRRYGAPTAQPWRGPRRSAAESAGKPLSNNQKAVISQTARQAFDVQDRAGLVDGEGSDSKRFETWRRAEQGKAVGISSLRECGNNHYRPLMAHFLTLAGRDASAFRLLVRSGRVRDHGAIADTHEARESKRRLIMDELLAHGRRCDPASADYDNSIAATVAAKGGIITAAYIVAIARNKCRGRGLDTLTAAELDQILWTTCNRIAAREGRGKTQNRNKSQRRS